MTGAFSQKTAGHAIDVLKICIECSRSHMPFITSKILLRLVCTIHEISSIQSYVYVCHIRLSVIWQLGFEISSEVFDMETGFEIICNSGYVHV